MLATTDKSLTAVTDEWLSRFERALTDPVALGALFRPDCHWRDVLALTWHIRTVDGRDAVAGGPHGRSRHACPEARLVPRAVGAAHAHHRRAGREVAAMIAARQDVRRPGRRWPRIPDPARRGRRW